MILGRCESDNGISLYRFDVVFQDGIFKTVKFRKGNENY